MRIAEADIRRVFQASLWLKGAHSMAEVLGGLALALLSHDLILRIVSTLTAAELLEDPRDLVANALRREADGFTIDARSFMAWYLFSHGLIKLVQRGVDHERRRSRPGKELAPGADCGQARLVGAT